LKLNEGNVLQLLPLAGNLNFKLFKSQERFACIRKDGTNVAIQANDRRASAAVNRDINRNFCTAWSGLILKKRYRMLSGI